MIIGSVMGLSSSKMAVKVDNKVLNYIQIHWLGAVKLKQMTAVIVILTFAKCVCAGPSTVKGLESLPCL